MEVIRNIGKRKFRTLLTIFGITIGVFSLVVMGGMAEKMNKLVLGATRYLENTIIISYQGSDVMFGMTILPSHLARTIEKVPGVQLVTKEITVPFEDEEDVVTFGMHASINGISIDEYYQGLKYMDPELALSFVQGTWWTNGTRDVAVLGSDLARRLKLQVGDKLKNWGKELTVVGILNQTMTGPDNMMFIDIQDAREMLLKAQPLLTHLVMEDLVNSMAAIAKPEEADRVAKQIMAETPEVKAIPPGKIMAEVKNGMIVFNLIIVASALIALVVGGLSVINTMLMSVTERIREIGIKKALGARDIDILGEYILEASLIGVIAGIIGVGCGALFCLMLNRLLVTTGTTIFLLTPRLVIGAVLFAFLISVFAGLWPAYRAVKIDPIKALRNE